MPWVSPHTWVAGSVLAASQLNTQLRDQLLALYGGAMALTNQADDDFIKASSATQLTRQGSADVKLWIEVFSD